MSQNTLEPLDPEIAALLEAAGSGEAVPVAARDRLFSRLALTLSLPLGPGTGTGSGGAGTDPTSGASPQSGPAPVGNAVPGSGAAPVSGAAVSGAPAASGSGAVPGAVALGHAASTSAPASVTLAQLVLPLARSLGLPVTMFALGAGTGAGVHAYLSQPKTGAVVSAVEAQAVPQEEAPPLAPEQPARAAEEPSPAPAAAAPSNAGAEHVDAVAPTAARRSEATRQHLRALPPGGDAKSDNELAAERTGLEISRTALRRGEAARALDALERHQREYPQAKLEEEREVLWVQALAAAGRLAEARTRGEAFEKRFPRSIFLPVVGQVLESIR